jgi:hypothetical protein
MTAEVRHDWQLTAADPEVSQLVRGRHVRCPGRQA